MPSVSFGGPASLDEFNGNRIGQVYTLPSSRLSYVGWVVQIISMTAYNLQLEVSNDGTNWAPLGPVINNTGSQPAGGFYCGQRFIRPNMTGFNGTLTRLWMNFLPS